MVNKVYLKPMQIYCSKCNGENLASICKWCYLDKIKEARKQGAIDELEFVITCLGDYRLQMNEDVVEFQEKLKKRLLVLKGELK